MTDVENLRKWLLSLLNAELAHMPIAAAVADMPEDLINSRPPNVSYTFWHLVEHLRITQWDVLDYIRNPNYQYIEWPKDYWPAPDATTDMAGWRRSVEQFQSDLEALKAIVRDPATDFFAQIPHGEPGHNILREILVVADHNSYHIGELGILRQVTDSWPKDRDGK
jgi:hypothetical protein